MTISPALAQLAVLFLRLGATAFGGPAAHVAMMRSEVVDRRRWLTDAEFLDLLAATHLIPGPNSTEMAIHLGLRRDGMPGLAIAGVCFILPAALIVAAIAYAYARFGGTPQAAWLMYGIGPVIIAVILQAVWKLGRAALTSPLQIALGAAVALLSLAGVNELALLAGGTLGGAGYFIGGRMADAVGRKPVIVLSILTGLTGGVGLYWLTNQALLFLAILLASLAGSAALPVGAVQRAELFPTYIRATAVQWLHSMAVAGSFLGLYLAAGAIDSWGLPTAVAVAGSGALVAALAQVWIPESAGADLSSYTAEL